MVKHIRNTMKCKGGQIIQAHNRYPNTVNTGREHESIREVVAGQH